MSQFALIGGGILSAVGSISQGFAARSAAKANARAAEAHGEAAQDAAEVEARQAERNAEAAEMDAELAVVTASFNERRFRRRAEVMQAENRALIGASGFTFEGSPMEVLTENAREIEEEALLIRYEGSLQERALLQEARLQRFQAEVSRFEGRQGLEAGKRRGTLERFLGKSAFSQSIMQAGTGFSSSLLAGASKSGSTRRFVTFGGGGGIRQAGE